MDNLGYKEIVLKGDQEPAMTSLMELIKAAWNGDAVLEHSPVRQSQANGAVERAIQSWQGQVRTLKDSLEYKINAKIEPDHPIMTWIVEHASNLQRRCQVGADGKTPYERSKGRRSRRPVAQIGEKIW